MGKEDLAGSELVLHPVSTSCDISHKRTLRSQSQSGSEENRDSTSSDDC